MNCPRTPLPLAQFHTMASATMGVCPAWDQAIANYLAADIRMRVQEVCGPLGQKMEASDGEAEAMQARYGPGWHNRPECTDFVAQHRRNVVAYEEGLREGFYEPQWQALRDVVRTPAPSFAAVAWKAALIEWEDMASDGLLEADCFTIVDADLARLTGDGQ